MSDERYEADAELSELSLLFGPDKPAQAPALAVILKRADPSPDTPSPQEETPMTDKTKADEAQPGAKADTDATAAKIARLEKVVALNADERAHFDTLTGKDADAFLGMSGSERAGMVTKAGEADAIVYTCKADGREIRKSDGANMLAMAKALDDQAERLAKMQGEADHATLMKRAESDLSTHAGTVGERAMVLKAIDAIPDDEARKRAYEIVKAGPVNDSAMRSFGSAGALKKSADEDDDSWGIAMKSAGIATKGD